MTKAHIYVYGCMHDVVVYKADFPRIDPNVVYTLEELQDMGLSVLSPAWHYCNRNDEVRDNFGEKISVAIDGIDYDKIRRDYNACAEVTLILSTPAVFTFSDGDKNYYIDRTTVLAKYTTQHIEERIVYRLSVLSKNNYDEDLYKYLVENFSTERKLSFEESNIIGLSENQFSVLTNYIGDVDFQKEWNDEDGGNLFVAWYNPDFQKVKSNDIPYYEVMI